MKQLYYLLACLCFGLDFSYQCPAQPVIPDSGLYRQSVKYAIDFYMTGMGKRSYLYNGSEYIFNNHGINGHPFFGSDQLIRSEIEYDGTLYNDVPLSYDLVQDKIFTTDSSMNFNIRLFNERVSYFSMMGHTFVWLAQDSGKASAVAPGFYDLLYNSKIKVLAKRTKQAEQGFKSEDPVRFVAYNEYFIWMNENYLKVESKKSLISAFPDKKDLVKKYYRKNDLDFKKDPENAIVRTTAYYSQLKN
jgi:hypothetical protein